MASVSFRKQEAKHAGSVVGWKLEECFEELLFLIAPGVNEKGTPLNISERAFKQPWRSS